MAAIPDERETGGRQGAFQRLAHGFGRIHVDVYFPIECARDPEERARMERALAEQLQSTGACFGRLRTYYGSAP